MPKVPPKSEKREKAYPRGFANRAAPASLWNAKEAFPWDLKLTQCEKNCLAFFRVPAA